MNHLPAPTAADAPRRHRHERGSTGCADLRAYHGRDREYRRGLAREYAQAGSRCLILQGRDAARLEEVQASCLSLGARVVAKRLDLRDVDALTQWLREISAQEAPDLVIANAGININTGPDKQGETWPDVQALLDVNIKAVFATVNGVLPAMRQRRGGQIALVSSLAAWRGLPETPSYSASKAAVKVYGEAMRDAWRARGCAST